MRAKTCKSCGERFTPDKPLQMVCSVPCAWAYVGHQNAKTDRRLTREAKAKLKPRSKWLQEAQAAFNKFIRLRDKDRPCISCGTHTAGKWDAGHYRSVGSNPALRFEPLNVHRQCVPCNQHLSGNAIEYRIGLIARIGREAVDFLEGPHEAKHLTIDDLKQIKADYTRIGKEMETTHG